MERVKYLIIGNGIAGFSAAKEIRKKDSNGSILMISKENYPTYYRLRLTEALGNNMKIEDLIINDFSWYDDNDIQLLLGKTVIQVIPEENKVLLDNQNGISYEKLLLATGSNPYKPPIRGSYKDGVFALRVLDDLTSIRAHIQEIDRVIVIGGGLLGIEAAWSLKTLGKKVTIVEFAPYLLPKQLDRELGEELANKLREQGIGIHLSHSVEGIDGKDTVTGIYLENGDVIKADAILISTGIVPNIDLVKKTTIRINRGIVVDNHLKTNIDNIYAAGDVAEFDDLIVGLWTTGNEQGKIAARNILGFSDEYIHPKPFTSLRVGEIKLFSAGNILDYDKIYEYRDGEEGFVKKLFVKNNKLVGSILFGDIIEMNSLRKSVFSNVDIDTYLKDTPNFKRK